MDSSPRHQPFFEDKYEVLLRLARRALAKERRDLTLTPEDLVHGLFPKELDTSAGETTLLRRMPRLMQRKLLDHHRRRRALKRGGDRRRERWTGLCPRGSDTSLPPDLAERQEDLLQLSQALERLRGKGDSGALQYEILVQGYFLGRSLTDIAASLGRDVQTIKSHMTYGVNYLRVRLDR